MYFVFDLIVPTRKVTFIIKAIYFSKVEFEPVLT